MQESSRCGLRRFQVRILTVADRFEPYANKIKDALDEHDVRVEVDARTESIGYKVKEAQAEKIPLIVTVGEKEEYSETVAIRTMDNLVKFNVKIEEFVQKVLSNIKRKRKLRLSCDWLKGRAGLLKKVFKHPCS